MNIKHIRIHGKTYPISPFEDACTSNEAVGFNDVKEGYIKYAKDQSDQSLRDTLLHEIIHILDYDMQLQLQERQVHCLATGILGVLLDNHDLARYLIGAKK